MTEQVKEVAIATSEKEVKKSAKFSKKDKINGLPPFATKFPEHVTDIALLIKNNAEIRRFTALGIINYLKQKKEISGEHTYVAFKWNKFAVKADGLTREFAYSELFFLNALVASFASFSNSAQRTIDNFCREEMNTGIGESVNESEVTEIADMNEQYVASSKTEPAVVE